MFRRIDYWRSVQGITKKSLAINSGIRYNTLLKKLRHKSLFTFDEAISVRTALKSNDSIEVLFEWVA